MSGQWWTRLGDWWDQGSRLASHSVVACWFSHGPTWAPATQCLPIVFSQLIRDKAPNVDLYSTWSLRGSHLSRGVYVFRDPQKRGIRVLLILFSSPAYQLWLKIWNNSHLQIHCIQDWFGYGVVSSAPFIMRCPSLHCFSWNENHCWSAQNYDTIGHTSYNCITT